jgi:ADP-ribose pyrophosphatase YjhB (NUDIX family)
LYGPDLGVAPRGAGRAERGEADVITCIFESGSRASLRHVVVHAIVEREGALLLVKRAPRLSEGGKWGLPGGFLDRDETLVEGVLRELREETGWTGEVRGLLRVNSRPDRPREDRQNVAFDFVITPRERVGEPDHESTAVEWVPIDRLPPLDALAFDHGETIRRYLTLRERPDQTPSVE